ncbi:unnamed protein product [Rotaria magnacalcarata]|uniref:Uncharacterized protein n=1 Tax=Rotaria magnacalcarata TaxID=392030 RepID=A0A814V295_9BILA|nr:unnamed protein product [Rotaria magnacalcarata]CAF1602413.1 unnamed protein product [Rotaria magnacalcarata]CAF2075040.1 unnamed protein product [Rotaria magnacalcarata]CAF3906650.1 unnamed protein product [Rotaria magnacalcarata]CAF4225927.1 unnamed protein product [Rotaria magnacalcarata]
MRETSGSGYAFDYLQNWDTDANDFSVQWYSLFEMIIYCRSSTMKTMEHPLSIEHTTTLNGKPFTFDQLCLMNISSDHLLSDGLKQHRVKRQNEKKTSDDFCVGET